MRKTTEWSNLEENILIYAYHSNMDLCELATRHLRSIESIKEKLISLGMIQIFDSIKPVRDKDFWSSFEEDVLVYLHHRGYDLDDLSARHLRKSDTVELKLIELGWLNIPGFGNAYEEVERSYSVNLDPVNDYENIECSHDNCLTEEALVSDFESNDIHYEHEVDPVPSEPDVEDSNNLLYSAGCTPNHSDSDWDDHFDDFDSESWGEYLGRPDDE